ncbi:MAG: hypothetical protein IH932_03165 [Thaumarchaeota archaeon]|nr:hypothetical protein [Nitrososphaerota archaeon]
MGGLLMGDDDTSFSPGSNINSSSFILECIDEALSELGPEVKDVLFLGLERIHSLPREQIPAKLALFDKAISSLLGVGAYQLKAAILEVAGKKLGIEIGSKSEFLGQMLVIKKRVDGIVSTNR